MIITLSTLYNILIAHIIYIITLITQLIALIIAQFLKATKHHAILSLYRMFPNCIVWTTICTNSYPYYYYLLYIKTNYSNIITNCPKLLIICTEILYYYSHLTIIESSLLYSIVVFKNTKLYKFLPCDKLKFKQLVLYRC